MKNFKEYEKNVASYKKYEKGGKDNDSLVAKAPKMGDLIAEIPSKLHVSGPIGATSVKKDSPNANDKHDGDGKAIEANGKNKGT